MKLSQQQHLALYWISRPDNKVTWSNVSSRNSTMFLCYGTDANGFRLFPHEINARTVTALIRKGLVEHGSGSHTIRATVDGRVYLQDHGNLP